MRTQRTVTTILGLFALALSTGTARGYCRSTTADPTMMPATRDNDGCVIEGLPLFWKSQCVGIHADEAASEYVSLSATRRLLSEAFAAWKTANGLCTPSIDVIQLSPVSSPKVEYSGDGTAESDVLYHDHGWPYLGAESAFELVTTVFEKKTGELRDADIEFNGARLAQLLQGPDGGTVEPQDVPGIRRVFVHAAGHFLGFGHSQDPQSVMSSFYSPDDTRVPVLSDDDAAGMCAAYPENGDRPTLDADGNPTVVPSTACNLSALTTAASPCSGGAVKLDDGFDCSVSVGHRASSASDAVLAAVALGLCAAGLRRRQSLPVRTTQ